MNEITVCVVDDVQELRYALEEIISMSEGYKCLGTFSNAEEAIAKLPLLKPDVVLMDINLGAGDNGKIFDALNAGASGYILKKTAPDKMMEAIQELHEGGAPMSSQIARKVVTTFQSKPAALLDKGTVLDELSRREQEILELLSKGLMYKEIAGHLFISQETVRKHVYHIYEKLHVNNRVEAVNRYFKKKKKIILVAITIY